MGKPILYYQPPSPAVRTVMLVAKAINLELELKYVDLWKKENYTPEFLKLNPHHTVPTLDDNGLALGDSHAITIYLIEKYGKTDALYPKDVAKRSIINQRLFFEASTLFGTLRNTCTDIFFEGHLKLTEKHIKKIEIAYELFNVLFTTNTFLVGDQVTLADYTCITSISHLNELHPFDDKRFPNILPWINRMEEVIPDYNEVHIKFVAMFKEMIAGFFAANAKK